MPGMTDRDHFAAAALTGLLASREWPIDSDEAAHYCYRVADAMLRERERTNHDAAPAARASVGRPRTDNADLPTCAGTGDTPEIAAYRRFVGEVMNWISEATSAYAPACSSDGGRKIMADACCRCWDAFDRIAYPTVHGAAPAARASVDSVAPQPTTRGESDRNDKAAPRPSDGTGDTPKPIKGGVSDRSKPINGPDPDSRVWETPVHTPATHATPGEGSVPREGTQEPVAWAVAGDYGEYAVALFADKESAQTEADRRALV